MRGKSARDEQSWNMLWIFLLFSGYLRQKWKGIFLFFIVKVHGLRQTRNNFIMEIAVLEVGFINKQKAFYCYSEMISVRRDQPYH